MKPWNIQTRKAIIVKYQKFPVTSYFCYDRWQNNCLIKEVNIIFNNQIIRMWRISYIHKQSEHDSPKMEQIMWIWNTSFRRTHFSKQNSITCTLWMWYDGKSSSLITVWITFSDTPIWPQKSRVHFQNVLQRCLEFTLSFVDNKILCTSVTIWYTRFGHSWASLTISFTKSENHKHIMFVYYKYSLQTLSLINTLQYVIRGLQFIIKFQFIDVRDYYWKTNFLSFQQVSHQVNASSILY